MIQRRPQQSDDPFCDSAKEKLLFCTTKALGGAAICHDWLGVRGESKSVE